MPQFAVFFSDGAGFGIEMAQAMDAAHAQDIARAQHPIPQLPAPVPAAWPQLPQLGLGPVLGSPAAKINKELESK